jgi:hypothetical protein
MSRRAVAAAARAPVVVTGPGGGTGKKTRKTKAKKVKPQKPWTIVETHAKGPGTAKSIWVNGRIVLNFVAFGFSLDVDEKGIVADGKLLYSFDKGDRVTIGEIFTERPMTIKM